MARERRSYGNWSARPSKSPGRRPAAPETPPSTRPGPERRAPEPQRQGAVASDGLRQSLADIASRREERDVLRADGGRSTDEVTRESLRRMIENKAAQPERDDLGISEQTWKRVTDIAIKIVGPKPLK